MSSAAQEAAVWCGERGEHAGPVFRYGLCADRWPSLCPIPHGLHLGPRSRQWSSAAKSRTAGSSWTAGTGSQTPVAGSCGYMEGETGEEQAAATRVHTAQAPTDGRFAMRWCPPLPLHPSPATLASVNLYAGRWGCGIEEQGSIPWNAGFPGMRMGRQQGSAGCGRRFMQHPRAQLPHMFSDGPEVVRQAVVRLAHLLVMQRGDGPAQRRVVAWAVPFSATWTGNPCRWCVHACRMARTQQQEREWAQRCAGWAPHALRTVGEELIQGPAARGDPWSVLALGRPLGTGWSRPTRQAVPSIVCALS